MLKQYIKHENITALTDCNIGTNIAYCAATSQLETHMPDTPVVVWSGVGILSWWHQPCRWQQPPPTAISNRQDVSFCIQITLLTRSLQLPVCGGGTVYSSYNRTSAADSSNVNWKESTDHGSLWLFASLHLRTTLTYLLMLFIGRQVSHPVLWICLYFLYGSA